MSEILHSSVALEFNEQVIKNQTLFEYSDNALYNLSIPLFSIAITLVKFPPPENLSLFKNLLKQQIIDLSEQGKTLNYPSAVIDKLCCVHCIVLDEFIVHSSWGENSGWENNTLLSELFDLPNGGDLFFTLIDKAMSQRSKMVDFISILYIYLQIGFKGRYRSRQTEKIGLKIKELRTVIADKLCIPDLALSQRPEAKAIALKTGRSYLSFLLIIIATLAFILTFFDYWFKETYSLRANELNDLDIISARLMKKASRDNDVSMDVLANKNQTKNKKVKQSKIIISKPISHTKLSYSSKNHDVLADKVPLYRIQLAAFSRYNNAQIYLAKFSQDKINTLTIKEIGSYFVVASFADSLAIAEQKKQYFMDNYQLPAIIYTRKLLDENNL